MVDLIKTKELSSNDKIDVVAIWNAVYPKSIAYENMSDFDSYFDDFGNPTHFILKQEHRVVGWASSFIRNNETWFAILLSPEVQGKGWGTKLLDKLKDINNQLNGWVILRDDYTCGSGEAYRSPIEFYLKNGFTQTNIELQSAPIEAIKIIWRKSGS